MAEHGFEHAAGRLPGPEAGTFVRRERARVASPTAWARRSAGTSTSTRIVLLGAGVVVICIAAEGYSGSGADGADRHGGGRPDR